MHSPVTTTPPGARPARPLIPVVGPVGRLGAAILAKALAALPYGGLKALAGFVAWLAWTLRIRRRVTLDNLARALPELPAAERTRIAKGAYRNMALVALEAIACAERTPAEIDGLLHAENWEAMEAALAQGRGVLLAAAHLGNWELLGAALAIRGLPIHAVVRPLTGALNERIVRSRVKAGLRLIAPRGAVRGTLKALARNEVVAMLLDQVLDPKHGVFVPFFGRLASTNPALSMAARRTGAPVFIAAAVRRGDGPGIRLTFEGPIPVPETSDVDADVRAHTAEVTARLEQWIRRYPDQWLWLHRRWKATPPGPETTSVDIRQR